MWKHCEMCKNFIHVFNIEDYLDASHHRSHREMISAEILKGEVKEPQERSQEVHQHECYEQRP